MEQVEGSNGLISSVVSIGESLDSMHRQSDRATEILEALQLFQTICDRPKQSSAELTQVCSVEATTMGPWSLSISISPPLSVIWQHPAAFRLLCSIVPDLSDSSSRVSDGKKAVLGTMNSVCQEQTVAFTSALKDNDVERMKVHAQLDHERAKCECECW